MKMLKAGTTLHWVASKPTFLLELSAADYLKVLSLAS